MKKILKFCGIVLVVGIGVLLVYSRFICHNAELELEELNKANKELLVLDKSFKIEENELKTNYFSLSGHFILKIPDSLLTKCGESNINPKSNQ